jgi:hypothetical protein
MAAAVALLQEGLARLTLHCRYSASWVHGGGGLLLMDEQLAAACSLLALTVSRLSGANSMSGALLELALAEGHTIASPSDM